MIFGVAHASFEISEDVQATTRSDDLALPPVSRMKLAFDQAGCNEVVEQIRHDRPVDAQIRCKSNLVGLLTLHNGGKGLITARTVRDITENRADGGVIRPE